MGPPHRVPPHMAQPHAAPVFYHPQYGYWCPHDYPYQQQALYNSQLLQHYYPQLYNPASPSASPYPYMGYVPGGQGPRTGFSHIHQSARPPLFQQPTAQIEGSFPPGPSLPPNFRLQLPPHAISRQPDDASGSQTIQPTSSTAAASTNNQEASKPTRSNSDQTTSN